ncbi:MAG: type II toxin-antitoxin system Phd/YefM family antitoxin [Proteobacteria bacterium]|nr:type II toxin-antitoxin system Phd/YefM family antitoxin [Pseudomonadota bacterium]
MEDQYTIVDAKNKLPSIIHSVESGQPVKLTRHGRPVAVLLSIKDYQRLSRKKVGYWSALNSFRKHMEKESIFFTEKDFENIRDNSSGRGVDFS